MIASSLVMVLDHLLMLLFFSWRINRFIPLRSMQCENNQLIYKTLFFIPR